ncbi:MAG TPA: AAA family ATPase [Erysipelotrichaceae bacterium]|nr:MAG: AAA family ATPase [Firmicutes bacterium GWE2_51_13]HBZ42038.1 AAA family ATPase [Erysipelotrichaceae bacterium]
MKKYYPRLIDYKINQYLNTFGAILIEGPKWCGKTTSASQHAKSILRMQDTSTIQNNMLIANTVPSLLLEGGKPRLIDEWQTAPVLWDAVRVDVDNTGEIGQYILTGSASPLTSSTMHTGTGRIARLLMRPMSLYESNDSSGAISLKDLLENRSIMPCKSSKSIQDIAYLICRGGWPQSINLPEESALLVMKEYVKSIYNNDIAEVDHIKTDPKRVESFLKAYSRHIQTLTKNTTILADMRENDIGISEVTLYSYLSKLQKMFIIEETSAWAPNIRSKTAIRSSNKKGFVDPSIATAILGLTPSLLLKDFELFGFMFESLCIRDLRVYVEKMDGQVLHYRDDFGLECDAVLKLPNGEYGLVEIKLGGKQEEDAAKNLIQLEKRFENKTKPILKMILTGGEHGYTRPDGIHVIPVACLKD